MKTNPPILPSDAHRARQVENERRFGVCRHAVSTDCPPDQAATAVLLPCAVHAGGTAGREGALSQRAATAAGDQPPSLGNVKQASFLWV